MISSFINAFKRIPKYTIENLHVTCQDNHYNSSKIVTVALFDRINKSGNYPSVTNLSQDWKIVNSHGITIPLNRIEVINSYPLNVISTATVCFNCIINELFMSKIFRLFLPEF
uniref:Uncharacterized protein n=1 Tax=Wuchereria bancrofti TaxID=6293 RepID=A0A1I8EBD1_WUCBA